MTSSPSKKADNLKRILFCCIILVFIGGLNSLWTKLDYKSWHSTLIRPSFAPEPDWIVAIFWGIVYTLLGISIGTLWNQFKNTNSAAIKSKIRKATLLFTIQMLINLTIPTLFFGLNNLYFVLIGVTINTILVGIMIISYRKINLLSSYILIPYLVWLLYAVILDTSILYLNS